MLFSQFKLNKMRHNVSLILALLLAIASLISMALAQSIDVEPKENVRWRIDTKTAQVTVFYNKTVYGVLSLGINFEGVWYTLKDAKNIEVVVVENTTSKALILITSHINVTNAMPEGWIVDVQQWLEFGSGSLVNYNVTVHPRMSPLPAYYAIHLLSLSAVNRVFDKAIADGQITTAEYATYSNYASIYSEKDGIEIGVIILGVKPETVNLQRYQRVSVKEQWVNAYEIENATLSSGYNYTLSALLYFDRSPGLPYIDKIYENIIAGPAPWKIRLQGPGFLLILDLIWLSVGLGMGIGLILAIVELKKKIFSKGTRLLLKMFNSLSKGIVEAIERRHLVFTVICLLVVVVVALPLYLPNASIDVIVHGDEIKRYEHIYHIINGWEYPYYPSPAGIYEGGLFLFVEAGFAKILGLSWFLYKFSGALFALLSSIVVYLLAKKMYGNAIGLCAFALALFSPLLVFTISKYTVSSYWYLIYTLTLLAFYNSLTNAKWFYLAFPLLGLSIETILGGNVLLAPSLILFLFLVKGKKLLKDKHFLLSIPLTLLPLFWFISFNLQSNFLPVRILVSRAGSEGAAAQSSSLWLRYTYTLSAIMGTVTPFNLATLNEETRLASCLILILMLVTLTYSGLIRKNSADLFVATITLPVFALMPFLSPYQVLQLYAFGPTTFPLIQILVARSIHTVYNSACVALRNVKLNHHPIQSSLRVFISLAIISLLIVPIYMTSLFQANDIMLRGYGLQLVNDASNYLDINTMPSDIVFIDPSPRLGFLGAHLRNVPIRGLNPDLNLTSLHKLILANSIRNAYFVFDAQSPYSLEASFRSIFPETETVYVVKNNLDESVINIYKLNMSTRAVAIINPSDETLDQFEYWAFRVNPPKVIIYNRYLAFAIFGTTINDKLTVDRIALAMYDTWFTTAFHVPFWFYSINGVTPKISLEQLMVDNSTFNDLIAKIPLSENIIPAGFISISLGAEGIKDATYLLSIVVSDKPYVIMSHNSKATDSAADISFSLEFGTWVHQCMTYYPEFIVSPSKIHMYVPNMSNYSVSQLIPYDNATVTLSMNQNNDQERFIAFGSYNYADRVLFLSANRPYELTIGAGEKRKIGDEIIYIGPRATLSFKAPANSNVISILGVVLTDTLIDVNGNQIPDVFEETGSNVIWDLNTSLPSLIKNAYETLG